MFKKRGNNSLLNKKKYRIDRPVKYKNPLKLKRVLKVFQTFKIINIILLIGIIASLYFFIFSSFYDITNVEIKGNEVISSEDLFQIIETYLATNKFVIFKNRNIFLLNKKKLIRNIENEVILEDITIEKILPNTLRIRIKEKLTALKWLNNNQEYLVDIYGQVIRRLYKYKTPVIFQLNNKNEVQASDNNPTEYLSIIDQSNQNINLGDQVLTQEDIQFIQQLGQKVGDYSYLQPKNYLVPQIFPESLILELEGGGMIHFNLADSLESQLLRLDLLIKEKISKDKLYLIEYIKLNLGEKVFFKYKEGQ